MIVHLDSTNAFWGYSIARGLIGEPTRFLADFDPVASPAELVASAGELSSAEVLERFSTSTSTLIELVESLDDDGWAATAEAPPGHLSMSAVLHHAHWDSWVHERDVLLPAGVTPVEDPTEAYLAMRYAAALAPALANNHGDRDGGTMLLEVTDDDRDIIVESRDHVNVRAARPDDEPDVTLSGSLVDLAEMLSARAPLPHPLLACAQWWYDQLEHESPS